MLKDDECLIKLTLKGLIGPMNVKGVKYPGQVPMTPFEHSLKDDEIAASLPLLAIVLATKPLRSLQSKWLKSAL